jgi:hypothetical protein
VPPGPPPSQALKGPYVSPPCSQGGGNSPKSNSNIYVTLSNLEDILEETKENLIEEMKIPTREQGKPQIGRKNLVVVTPGNEPITSMGISSIYGIHVILEEESKEAFDEDLGKETKVLVTIKKWDRKPGHNKRDEVVDK